MVQLIGAASGWGAQIRGCEEGPEAFELYLHKKDVTFLPWHFLFPKKRAKEGHIPLPECFDLVYQFNEQLAEKLFSLMIDDQFPFVVGGDHSIAAGTWSGVHKALERKGELPLGLIWIDSHMDAHTPETTPSGAWHGMPLAALLGYGPMSQGKPIISPTDLCLIGVRSFEEGEAALLHSLGVRIFFMDEIEEKGMERVMEEALSIVTKKTKAFGLSLDLDAFDPEEAPGVGSPEERGIAVKEVLAELHKVCAHAHFRALELVEYNPYCDKEEKTAQICSHLLSVVLNSVGVCHG